MLQLILGNIPKMEFFSNIQTLKQEKHQNSCWCKKKREQKLVGFAKNEQAKKCKTKNSLALQLCNEDCADLNVNFF